jgi:hypothetical protein
MSEPRVVAANSPSGRHTKCTQTSESRATFEPAHVLVRPKPLVIQTGVCSAHCYKASELFVVAVG